MQLSRLKQIDKSVEGKGHKSELRDLIQYNFYYSYVYFMVNFAYFIYLQGVDLSLTKSMAFSDMSINQPHDTRNDLTSLVTTSPSQGTLRPYDKRLLHFKFSPRATTSSRGWSSTERPQPRRDFALFVHIDIVGNIEALHGDRASAGSNGKIYFGLSEMHCYLKEQFSGSLQC